MTKDEMQRVVALNTPSYNSMKAVLDAVDAYSSALLQPQLPPVVELEQALNLAQAEIRAMYKKAGIKGSNVLDLVDKNLEAVQAAMA